MPKAKADLSVFKFRCGLVRLNNENIISINPKTVLTIFSFVPFKKNKPRGIPRIENSASFQICLISSFCQFLERIKTDEANPMNATIGVAVLMLMNKASNGIAISASPNPNVERYSEAPKTIKSTKMKM